MASSAFEADVYQHIEAIKAANVYAAMSGSIEAVQPAEALQRTLDVEGGKNLAWCVALLMLDGSMDQTALNDIANGSRPAANDAAKTTVKRWLASGQQAEARARAQGEMAALPLSPAGLGPTQLAQQMMSPSGAQAPKPDTPAVEEQKDNGSLRAFKHETQSKGADAWGSDSEEDDDGKKAGTTWPWPTMEETAGNMADAEEDAAAMPCTKG